MSAPLSIDQSKGIWSQLNQEMKLLFNDDLYREWFKPLICVGEKSDALILETPTEFSAIWIEENYLEILTRKAEEIAGRSVALEIRVSGNANQNSAQHSVPQSTSVNRTRSIMTSVDRGPVTNHTRVR